MFETPGRECHCLLCDGHLGEGDRAEPSWPEREQQNASLVRRFGWGVTGVLGMDQTPDWAYTVGLWHSYGSVELALLGLPQKTAANVVNTVAARIRDGLQLTPGLSLSEVVRGYDVRFAPVHPSWYSGLIGAALDFYQVAPLPVVQVLWPDRAGHYPGDPALDAPTREAQPTLWLPKDEHPPSVWTVPPAPWSHPDLDPCTIVFTLTRILDGHRPVNGVVRDEDGSWQFLDGDPLDDPDVTTVHLSHLVSHHDVGDLLDLPAGWSAWRQPDGTWLRAAGTGL